MQIKEGASVEGRLSVAKRMLLAKFILTVKKPKN